MAAASEILEQALQSAVVAQCSDGYGIFTVAGDNVDVFFAAGRASNSISAVISSALAQCPTVTMADIVYAFKMVGWDVKVKSTPVVVEEHEDDDDEDDEQVVINDNDDNDTAACGDGDNDDIDTAAGGDDGGDDDGDDGEVDAAGGNAGPRIEFTWVIEVSKWTT